MYPSNFAASAYPNNRHVSFAQYYRRVAIYNSTYSNWDMALRAISKGLYLENNKEIRAHLFILLSEAFYHKGSYGQAIKVAKIGLSLTCDKQKKATLYLAMTMPLLEQGFFGTAEACAKNGINWIKDTFNPQIASELYAGLAWSKYKQYRYKEACDIATKALNTYSSSLFNHTKANLYMVKIHAAIGLGRKDIIVNVALAGLRLTTSQYFRNFFLTTLNKCIQQ